MNCIFCNSNKFVILYKGKKVSRDILPCFHASTKDFSFSSDILKCKNCGLICAVPTLSEKEIENFYKAIEDTIYLSEEIGRRNSFNNVLEKIKKYKPGGSILDIGCHTGIFLDICKKAGWQVKGVEPSVWAVNYAQKEFNIPVLNTSFEKATFEKESFDAIVMMDSIEHLFDPWGAVKKSFLILKPDGLIYISTPNTHSLSAKLLRSRWACFREAHLFYFTPNVLRKWLLNIGFEVKESNLFIREFTFKYWVSKLGYYNKNLYKILEKLGSLFCINDKIIKLMLPDEFEIIALKKSIIRNEGGSRKAVGVVMPAYNAEKTLSKTYYDIPQKFVKEIILVDDASYDKTVEKAKELGLKVIVHKKNLGYGGNQKTCYKEMLKSPIDIIVMLHPDYQYDPIFLPKLIRPIQEGKADCVLGSRILYGNVLKRGMPVYKYAGNRIITLIENLWLRQKFSEYHTGYRAYSRKALESIPFESNSNNFVFDTEIIIQLVIKKFTIKEIPIPTRYFKEASTVDFFQGLRYSIEIFLRLLYYLIWKLTGMSRFLTGFKLK